MRSCRRLRPRHRGRLAARRWEERTAPCSESRAHVLLEISSARTMNRRIVQIGVARADTTRQCEGERDVSHLLFGMTVRTKRESDTGRKSTTDEALVRPV